MARQAVFLLEHGHTDTPTEPYKDTQSHRYNSSPYPMHQLPLVWHNNSEY